MVRIAVVSFPGNNCEVESLRALKDSGMEAMFFRWNDDRNKLVGVDGYFIPGGFSYEDRGRSGMVAGRDTLMDFIGQEAEAGKVIIGNCNGAQILVESGIIPLEKGLQMCLARNALDMEGVPQAIGFLSQWVWITPVCRLDRCATSDWKGPMHVPIAHGEGRFTTRDASLLEELKKNDQIAFSYCDSAGNVSGDPVITPNGSVYAIAGVCNQRGNVVAIMPHPERTQNGKPYFDSMKKWIEQHQNNQKIPMPQRITDPFDVSGRKPKDLEIFIDTIIVNNEERTVELTAKRYAQNVKVKQWKYLAPTAFTPEQTLSNLSVFNSNKERAFIRRGSIITRWNHENKSEDAISAEHADLFYRGIALLRRDIPDTGAVGLGEGSETGVCSYLDGVGDDVIQNRQFLEVFCNPHSSILERLV